jgi:transcriptional regulator with XRE-family HTH domain
MTLGEKLKYLREVEGHLEGLGRPLTQSEVAKGVRKATGKAISQSYLSQIERGTRPHLTEKTRAQLASFFKVHPGFLVEDPQGFQMELVSDLRTAEGQLDIWLLQGAEQFRSDKEVSETLTAIAAQKETRETVLLLGAILRTPGLAAKLRHALQKPEKTSGERGRTS